MNTYILLLQQYSVLPFDLKEVAMKREAKVMTSL